MTTSSPDPANPTAPAGDGGDAGAVVAVAGVGATIVERMRADLPVAIRERDRHRVQALRTALAAVANAEAPPIVDGPSSADAPVVGRLQEHRRLDLTVADVEAILRAEVADRVDTASQFEAHGRGAEAEDVRREAAVIGSYLR